MKTSLIALLLLPGPAPVSCFNSYLSGLRLISGDLVMQHEASEETCLSMSPSMLTDDSTVFVADPEVFLEDSNFRVKISSPKALATYEFPGPVTTTKASFEDASGVYAAVQSEDFLSSPLTTTSDLSYFNRLGDEHKAPTQRITTEEKADLTVSGTDSSTPCQTNVPSSTTSGYLSALAGSNNKAVAPIKPSSYSGFGIKHKVPETTSTSSSGYVNSLQTLTTSPYQSASPLRPQTLPFSESEVKKVVPATLAKEHEYSSNLQTDIDVQSSTSSYNTISSFEPPIPVRQPTHSGFGVKHQVPPTTAVTSQVYTSNLQTKLDSKCSSTSVSVTPSASSAVTSVKKSSYSGFGVKHQVPATWSAVERGYVNNLQNTFDVQTTHVPKPSTVFTDEANAPVKKAPYSGFGVKHKAPEAANSAGYASNTDTTNMQTNCIPQNLTVLTAVSNHPVKKASYSGFGVKHNSPKVVTTAGYANNHESTGTIQSIIISHSSTVAATEASAPVKKPSYSGFGVKHNAPKVATTAGYASNLETTGNIPSSSFSQSSTVSTAVAPVEKASYSGFEVKPNAPKVATTAGCASNLETTGNIQTTNIPQISTVSASVANAPVKKASYSGFGVKHKAPKVATTASYASNLDTTGNTDLQTTIISQSSTVSDSVANAPVKKASYSGFGVKHQAAEAATTAGSASKVETAGNDMQTTSISQSPTAPTAVANAPVTKASYSGFGVKHNAPKVATTAGYASNLETTGNIQTTNISKISTVSASAATAPVKKASYSGFGVKHKAAKPVFSNTSYASNLKNTGT